MRVRRLDANGDMTFGEGQSNFWRDVPDAPAQCVMTRLVFWEGQWFLDTRDGTPYQTKVLGKYTGSTRDPVMKARALGTQGVDELVDYSSDLNRDTRAFTVNMTIDTIYGPAKVSGVF